MALQGPRILQNTVTAGTGPFQLLDPAPNSFQRYRDVFATNAVTTVIILDQNTGWWQESLVQLTYGVPDLLTVLQVISSSNGGSAVTFNPGNKLVIQSQPSYGSQALDRIKHHCRAVSLTNVAVSSLAVGLVVDGVTLAAGDRVGLFGQTTTTECGIYVIPATGAATRSIDFWAGDHAGGSLIPVSGGTVHVGQLFICTSVAGSDIIGTSSLTFASAIGDYVSGPTTSTTDAIAVFKDATGQVLRNSSVFIHSGVNDKLDYAASFGAVHTATYAATTTFDFDLADNWEVTLTGNVTLAIANASIGQRVRLLIQQDATGGRTVTWFGNINWNAGSSPFIDTAANGWNLVELQCVADDGYGNPIWYEVASRSSAGQTVRCIVNSATAVTTLVNQSTGTGAINRLVLQNDAGNQFYMQICGHEHGTAPDQCYLWGSNIAGIHFSADGVSDAMYILPGAHIGFFGATPVVQPSGSAQAQVSTAAATNSSPYGFATAAQANGVITLLNALQAALVNLGLIKGGA